MSEIKKYSRMGEELMVYGGNSSQTATTMQQMMDFMKQEADTVGDVVDSILWQPSATVRVGQVVFSANLPAGYVAIATTGGQTGDVEPIWSTNYATFSDGTVVWKLETLANKLSLNLFGIESSNAEYIRYTNGLQICWGLNCNAGTPIAFPVPFKDANVSITATQYAASETPYNVIISAFSKTSVTFKTHNIATNTSVNVSDGIKYIAIGYWK